MKKTIKQIADEIGIDKQKVYRYIKKNHINEALNDKGVMYYDEISQRLIKREFATNKSSNSDSKSDFNDVIIDTLLSQFSMLKDELDSKNIQIAEMQKLLDQEQQLRMAEHQRVLQLEEKKEKKSWWKFNKETI